MAQASITDVTGGAAPDISKCSGIGTEEVNIIFPAADADGNATISLTLPPGVSYICGSVAQQAGAAIMDAVSCDAAAPVFDVSGLGGAGSNVRFTFDLEVDCNSAAGSNILTIDVGNSGSNNCVACTDNIFIEIQEASLASQLVGGLAHPNVTNLAIGQSGSVDVSVVNLGQGMVDSLTFCIDNPSGLIATNSLMLGTTTLTGVASGTQICYSILASDDPGNFGGDGLLSITESITLTRNFTIIGCTGSGTTISDNYLINFGCSDDECQTTSSSPGNFILAFGEPSLVHNIAVFQASNTCNAQIFDVTYTNNGNGDPIAGAAYDLLAKNGIGFNIPSHQHPDWSLSSFELVNGASTVPMSSTGGTNPDIGQTNFEQFASDPDGAGGLDDLDGDGQFDDLPVGESVTLRISYTYDCPNVCGQANVGFLRYTHQLTYTDQCENPLSIEAKLAGRFDALRAINSKNYIVSPPNISDGDIFNAELAIDYGINAGQLACNAGNPSGALVKVEFTLPPGVTVASTPNATFNDDPATLTTTATTAIVEGTYSTNGNGGGVRFSLDFLYTCPAVNPSIPYNVTLICDPTCSCEIAVDCGTIEAVSNCPGPCGPGGLGTTQANIERTTVGFTDATATTKVDPTTISAKQLARVNPCDTVILTIKGEQRSGSVFTTGTADNAHIELSYDLAGGGRIFEALGGTFIHYDNSTMTYSAPIPLPAPTNLDENGQHIINWNLTSLLPGGIIELNDSIILSAAMTVLTNNSLPRLPSSLANSSVLMYTMASAADNPLPNGDPRYTCGGWILEAYPFRFQLKNDFVGFGFAGCQSSFFEARWSCINAPTFDPFPGEIRPYAAIDSFILDISGSGLLLDPNQNCRLDTRGSEDDDSLYPYSQTLTPVIANADKIVFVNQGGTEYVFPDYNFNTNRVSLFVPLLPSCATGSTGTITLNSYFQENPQTMDFDCSADLFASRVLGFNVDFPNILITEQTGTKVGDELTECFDVRVRNTSGSLDSEHAFLELLDASSTMNVVEATHKTTNGVTVDTLLTLLPYADGQWIPLSEQFESSDFYDVEVCVEYTDCAPQTLTVSQGFDCADFPSPDPSSLACNLNPVELTLEPVSAILQGQLLTQPAAVVDACGTYTYELLLTSAGAANLLDPEVTVELPDGLTLQSAAIAYPYNTSLGSPYSGTFEASTPTLGLNSATIDLSQHSMIASLLPGGNNELTGDAPLEDRQVLVQFVFVSDCDFVSGIRMDFEATGTAPCGETTRLRILSSPLELLGINASLQADIALNLADTVFTCAPKTLNPTLTYIDIEADGLAYSTGSSDTVLVSLADGLSYVAGTYAGDDANAPIFVETRTVAGSEVIVLAVPQGISIPDLGNVPTGFSFDVIYDFTQACGATGSIAFAYQENFPPLSCASAAGGVCPNDATAILGSLDVEISLDELLIENLTIDDAATPNVYIGTFDVTNGDLLSGDSIILEAFCTEDLGMTTPIGSTTVYGPIADGTLNVPYTIDYDASSCTSGGAYVGISSSTSDNVEQCVCGVALTSDTPLPVELADFTVSNANCQAALSWVTESEENSAYFDVEYSRDGENFDFITRIAGSGSTQETTNYSYTHADINRIENYYRLKIVALNGTYEYSQVLFFDYDCEESNSIIVRPIPVKGSEVLTVDYYLGEQDFNEFKVFNTLGVLVKRIPLESLDNGWNSTKIQVSDLPSGSYYIQGIGQEVGRFIVIN